MIVTEDTRVYVITNRKQAYPKEDKGDIPRDGDSTKEKQLEQKEATGNPEVKGDFSGNRLSWPCQSQHWSESLLSQETGLLTELILSPLSQSLAEVLAKGQWSHNRDGRRGRKKEQDI